MEERMRTQAKKNCDTTFVVTLRNALKLLPLGAYMRTYTHTYVHWIATVKVLSFTGKTK